MASQPACENLCVELAGSGPFPIIPISGVCQFMAVGFTISDVVILSCAIQSVSLEPVTDVPRAALLTVVSAVTFQFTATFPDGSTATETAVSTSTVQFVQVLTATHSVLLVPLQCTPALTCTASDAGFNAATGIQSFIVAVSGTVDCVDCSSTKFPVNVQLCPTPPAATAASAALPSTVTPPTFRA